jgi:small-conductance mechanosensitive channel
MTTITPLLVKTGFWNSIGQYSKGIVVTAAAVVTALQPYYGSQHWFAAVTAGLGALGVVLIPNQPKQ